jgi:hypothetical protein
MRKVDARDAAGLGFRLVGHLRDIQVVVRPIGDGGGERQAAGDGVNAAVGLAAQDAALPHLAAERQLTDLPPAGLSGRTSAERMGIIEPHGPGVKVS